MRGRGRRARAAFLTLTVAWFTPGCTTNVPVYTALTAAPETVFVVPGEIPATFSYDGSSDFGALFAEYLAGALQTHGISAIALPRGAAAPTSARFVVVGDILEMDSGSWNLRFWIGFGAGPARVRARIKLNDVDEPGMFYERIYEARSITLHFEENILRRVLGKLARSAAAGLSARIRGAVAAERLPVSQDR